MIIHVILHTGNETLHFVLQDVHNCKRLVHAGIKFEWTKDLCERTQLSKRTNRAGNGKRKSNNKNGTEVPAHKGRTADLIPLKSVMFSIIKSYNFYSRDFLKTLYVVGIWVSDLIILNFHRGTCFFVVI